MVVIWNWNRQEIASKSAGDLKGKKYSQSSLNKSIKENLKKNALLKFDLLHFILLGLAWITRSVMSVTCLVTTWMSCGCPPCIIEWVRCVVVLFVAELACECLLLSTLLRV